MLDTESGFTPDLVEWQSGIGDVYLRFARASL